MADNSRSVDVIILSLNRTDETIDAIESALAQTGVDKTVYVVDQASEPENLQRLTSHCARRSNVHLKALSHNLGVAGGRNVASRLGHAPYIVALDNDALFADERVLAETVDYLQAHPELGAIGFQILNYTTKDIDERSWGYPKAIRHKASEEFYSTRFVGAGHAIARRPFEEVGGYDDRLFFCWEELDLGYKLINLGYKIRYVPHLKVYHRVSPHERVNWSGGRYYFTVRNRLYIEYKFGASVANLGQRAVGYFLKGAYNGVPGQAARGIRDAWSMCRSLNGAGADARRWPLNGPARDYVYLYDLAVRGGLWRQIRTDVLARFPSRPS